MDLDKQFTLEDAQKIFSAGHRKEFFDGFYKARPLKKGADPDMPPPSFEQTIAKITMNESTIRSIVRNLLKEAFQGIQEAQKGKKIDTHIQNLLNSAELDIIGEFPYDKDLIMREVRSQINSKLNKVGQTNYNYPDFYIVRLGSFVVKDGDKTTPLSFKLPRFDKNFSYPYLYVYQDKMIVFKFGSRFYDNDQVIMKMATKFIKDLKINLVTKTEQGKIIINNDFDTPNVIDFTDYSKIQRPQAPKQEPKLAKEKATYRVGGKINHPKFGKGTIIKTERFGAADDGSNQYKVTISFSDKERTLLLKSKKSQVAA